MIDFQRILFPTDFSESAGYASEYAISLASKYGSNLYILHVIEHFAYIVDFGIDFQSQTSMEATAQKLLEDTVASIRKKGADAEGVIVSGDPFVEIIKFAKREQIDLIVMATHGRTGLEHMLMGSVAEKVVRKSPCPVLTVKKHGQIFTMP